MVVLAEIENTPNADLRNKLRKVIQAYGLNIIDINSSDQQRIFELAGGYIKAKIIPQRKFDDAVHVAICVEYGFDILLSWNFRHLANIRKQIQINAFNKNRGYLKDLFLLSPMEVIYEKE